MSGPYTIKEILKTKEYNKIGEVVDIISDRYPDITASAIRYWDSVGLLTPTKTSGGQRLYTVIDMELIKYIKELSRCGYSIKKIREKIQKLEKGKEPIVWAADKERKELAISRYMELYNLFNIKEKMEPVYSRKDLIKILRSKIAKELLDTAIEYKLVIPTKVKRKFMFSAYDEMFLRIIIYKDEKFKDTFVGGWERYIEECREVYEVCKYLYHTYFIFGKLQVSAKDYSETQINNALFNLISEKVMCGSASRMLGDV
jgi:DNA-binding transcriptional MerR regulator